MTFAAPYWLLLLPVVGWLAWRTLRAKAELSLRLPAPSGAGLPRSWRGAARRVLPWLRWLALVLLVVALARPQRRWQEERIKADAIDIVLSMDISPSMLSRDFEPDRLTVARALAVDFVQKRPYDRLSLVAFSAEAFTQCPLTTDHRMLQRFIQELQVGVLQDGTAIGMGLATAIDRLKDSPSKSKIVILLTDGENNAGYIDPEQAAEIAVALKVRVYTVGIGSEGLVLSPSHRNLDGTYEFDFRNADFDTELLQKIAQKTNGKFYRARSPEDLQEIYAEIDRLEKTKVEVTTIRRTTEWFAYIMVPALILLVLEMLLRWLLLKAITI
jgi:Ca-activated chloride channel homolog